MAEAGFDGGPKVFDRIEVGRVGRQKQPRTADRRDQCRRGRRLMEAGVVQHDHAARRQHRQEHLRKIRVHHLRVARARKSQRGDQPAVLAGGHDAGSFPPFPRHRFINPLAAGGAAVFPIQPVIHAALVQIIHAGGRQLFQLAPEEPPLHFVPLAIFDEFFLA